MKSGRLGMLFAALALGIGSARAVEICDVCERVNVDKIFTWQDRITNVKKRLCNTCTDLPTVCYVCGVPTRDFQSLADGRTLCRRDGSSVILDDEVAARMCEDVRLEMDRHFIRFITFPETNVSVNFMDRVRIQEIYKFAGNDFSCPNMWGCTITRTNDGRREFEISLLSGLPRPLLEATTVHEHTHTWVRENLPEARMRRIDKDAIEGFCELVSYLYVQARGLTAAREHILGNHYTRGQIHLLLEAERQFGFNDVVEWMKYGVDQRLFTNQVARVRELRQPVAPASQPVFIARGAPPRAFQEFVLQGITWSRTRPMALVNGRNFELGDVVKVPLGETNVSVRCMMITETNVVIQSVGEATPQTLSLTKR